ncbi:C-C motif chemokine 19-like [Eublepharis macularius]|uniref:C-C motif chemokine 19-like n=1 Tax=Eublepharis macularius TaxID=481883 RepID=A0AA97L4N1_EUBMA|nr:C-C motif chemokine 19-like [Eublepharis macularius]
MARRPPRPLALLLLAALASALLAQGRANSTQDCCISVSPSSPIFPPNLQKRLVSYRIQGPEMGCHLEAIVFITQRGRQLCVSPDADWAPKLMKRIDKKNRKAATNGRGI